jgi:hypothetical protein
MNKEQQELLDLAYKDYVESYNKGNASGIRLDDGTERVANIDEFIRRIRQDIPFAQKFALKFEKRELSMEERAKWLQDNKGYDLLVGNLDHDHIREVVEEEAPTKLITITYNDTKLESYE